jgi:hypothetical protein
MTLSVGSSASKHKGIFITKATVKSVVDLSRQPLQYLNKAFDLAIKIKFDIGRTFDKEVTVFGNFKRNADASVASFGSAFKVAKFFETLGINGSLTPTNELPLEWFAQSIGKTCYVLDYVVGIKDNGKPKYFTWDLFGFDDELLVNDFYKGVKKGFPKNFCPDILDEIGTEGIGDAYEPSGVATSASPADDFSF